MVNWIEDNDLFLVNQLDQSHTHYDASSRGESNILDFGIIDDPKLVKAFKVDTEKVMTPYRLRSVKGQLSHTYTDHRSLLLTLNPSWCKKPLTNKITGWNYSKKDGDLRYKELTDEFAPRLAKAVEEVRSVDELYDWYRDELNKIKMESYGKSTSTIKRAKEIEDDKMWHARLNDVNDCMQSLNKKKVNDKIWELRSKTSLKFADTQFVSVVKPGTKTLTQNREDTNKTVLDYNFQLLRKGQVKKDEETLRDDLIKDIIISVGMDLEEIHEDKEITWKEFQQVITKVKLSGKSIYRDIVKGGEIFKYAFFGMLSRMYRDETIPRDFQSTTLMKLYKNKGSRNELNNNRFIHLKDYASKIYERLIMQKIEGRMSSSTPDFQIGGQKQSSTTEHLLTLMIFMSKIEKTKGAGICQFLDIKKCFDVIELRDILAETVRSGVTGKPLRNIASFTDRNVITIQGDDSGETRTVANSSGQGSGYAPTGTALTMATTIEDKVHTATDEKGREIIKNVDGITLSQLMFVDDISKCCIDSEESKDMGEVYTKSLKTMKMEAHPDKSCLVVFGKKREELKRDVTLNPTVVQGFTMGIKEQETYLGMQFSEVGASDSITKTLLSRRVKCMTKSTDLRRKLEDTRVQALGWLITGITVFKAVIQSTLLYGCGSWVRMTKAQEDLVEAIQRQCLTTALGITSRCHYLSLLHVTGIQPAMELVRKTKVTFINDLFHIKGKGIALKVIKQEAALDPTKGIVAEVKTICAEGNLPDVTEKYAAPRALKEKITSNIKTKVLLGSLSSKSAPMHYIRDKTNQVQEYFTMPKEKALLGLALDVGCLNFRGSRKNESRQKYGTSQCWVPGCTGLDTLDHVMTTCQGYKARRGKDVGIKSEFIDYLHELNRERVSRFRTSLVHWKS